MCYLHPSPHHPNNFCIRKPATGGLPGRRRSPLYLVLTYFDLAHLGGHARHILPPFSPSRPVFADEEIICWGTLLNFFAFFAFCDIPFLVFSPFLLTFVSFRKEPFHFLFILFSALEEESSSPILFCAGRFFARPTYEYIRGCCHRASSDIYDHHRTTSTAQQCSRAQSTRATSSKASTLRSERDNAGKQTELARASMSSSIYTVRCVLQTNEEIEICSAYKTIAGGVMREGFAYTLLLLSVSVSVPSMLSIHVASGLFLGTMELLAFASR